MSAGPRFEVVHTGARQFHARLIYGNGEIGWTTETFTRRRAAHRAIDSLVHAVDVLSVQDDGWPERLEVDER